MKRVLEELCNDDACTRAGVHWHRFDVESFLQEENGEYTVTLRVRVVATKKRAPRPKT